MLLQLREGYCSHLFAGGGCKQIVAHCYCMADAARIFLGLSGTVYLELIKQVPVALRPIEIRTQKLWSVFAKSTFEEVRPQGQRSITKAQQQDEHRTYLLVYIGKLIELYLFGCH